MKTPTTRGRWNLQALRVPLVGSLASASRRAAGGSGPALTTALAPLGSAVGASAGVAASRVAATGVAAAAAGAELAVDESEGLLAVDADVALVGGLAVSGAAVRVGGVAVGLDLARVGADEAGGAGVELDGVMRLAIEPSTYTILREDDATYSTGTAGSNLVGKTVLPSGVAHEDGGLDLANGGRGNGHGSAGDTGTGVAAAAEGIVHDLTTLRIAVSTYSPRPWPG